MSVVEYVKCDGCGAIWPDPPEEASHFHHGWVAVDGAGFGGEHYDLCAECAAKALEAAGVRRTADAG